MSIIRHPKAAAHIEPPHVWEPHPFPCPMHTAWGFMTAMRAAMSVRPDLPRWAFIAAARSSAPRWCVDALDVEAAAEHAVAERAA